MDVKCLEVLKTSKSSTSVLNVLVKLRKDMDFPKHKHNIIKFREEGGLKCTAGLLGTPERKISNLALSILGNCCMDIYSSRELVVHCNIFAILYKNLEKNSKIDSITGRILRIIGNICSHREQWASTLIERQPEIVTHIVNCLKGFLNNENYYISEATICMALRCLREFWNKGTLEKLDANHNVLNVIGLLLIKYSNEWEENRNNKNILENIIKVLEKYSKYEYSQMILKLRNTEKGNCLISLTKILFISPKKVVRVIMNFIKISQFRSDLPVPEVFDCFINILKDKSVLQDMNEKTEEYVGCLCYLFDHPVSRNYEICNKSVSVLIEIMKNLDLNSSRKINCYILILQSFKKSQYDETLIKEQLDNNIISILLEKLEFLLGNVGNLNVPHKCQRKRRLNTDCSNPSATEHQIFMYKREDSSNNECDAMSWTSGSSQSPRDLVESDSGFSQSPTSDLVESDDSEADYSPICSDFEYDPNEDDSEKRPSIFDPDFGPWNSDSPTCVKDSKKISVVLETVRVLKMYKAQKPAILQLGNPKLLQILINGFIYFDLNFIQVHSSIIEYVYNILEVYDYLLPLLQTNFLQKIYENLIRTQHGSVCLKCIKLQNIGVTIMNTLTNCAESAMGQGDIANILLKSEDFKKQQFILSVPYVVKKLNILRKFLINCGGLDVLFRILKDEEIRENCVEILSVIVGKFQEKIKSTNCANTPVILLDKYELYGNDMNVVAFKLDDGSVIAADRTLLCENSDFFSRLLSGNFKESTQDEIRLRNVQKETFSSLLNLLKYNLDKDKLVKFNLELGVYLDLIALCDRFLMPDLHNYLSECFKCFQLSYETIPRVYLWSLEYGGLLRMECIQYIFTAGMIDFERDKMFIKLFQSGCDCELISDIRTFIINRLGKR